MPIRFRCPACDQQLSIGTRKAGVRTDCPNCKAVVTVPDAAPIGTLSSTRGRTSTACTVEVAVTRTLWPLAGAAMTRTPRANQRRTVRASRMSRHLAFAATVHRSADLATVGQRVR